MIQRFGNIAHPAVESAYSPHASGGGALEAGYTGTSAGTLDCSALAGCLVEIRTEVDSDGSDGSEYRYCWITAAEAAGSPGFTTSDASAALEPAEGSKVPSKMGGTRIVTQMVDADRPHLLYAPYASVSAGESIIVAVAQPTGS